MTDAYFIILCRALGISSHENLIKRLVARLLDLQNTNGTWSVYPDEPAVNLSITLEASYALLCSGLIPPDDEQHLLRAKSALKNPAATAKLSMSTRAFFSGIGQLPWSNYRFPASILVAPKWSPIQFDRFVGYARAHIAPVLLASLLNTNVATQPLPKLADLSPDILELRNPTRKESILLPNLVPTTTILKRLEEFILENLETNGTLYGYASSTFFMIMALIGRGYPPHDPIITRAIDGIASLAHHEGPFSHIQNADATVWNTGLMSYALQAVERPENIEMLARSTQYLLAKQHLYTRNARPSSPLSNAVGWGFSDINTFVPDVDDTCAVLRALHRGTQTNWNGAEAKAFARGINWIWSMQNRDGGWPAFEKDVDNPLFTKIRVDGATGVLTDPSSADLTGRTLEFLGNYCNLTFEHPKIKKAVRWLLKAQNANGSWQGRWGVCYIYGTWAAITGLCAVGLSKNHPALRKAAEWLLSIQRPDGGFGESCQSDVQKKYVPLTYSTISQTAWGLDALISMHDEPTSPIRHATDCLLKQVQDLREKWATYPTGAGLPGSFYIGYQSYNTIWPLVAFGHYKQKYGV